MPENDSENQRQKTPYTPLGEQSRFGARNAKFPHRPGSGGRLGANDPRSLRYGNRFERAAQRQILRNKLSPSEQLAVLDQRLGDGIGAERERQRLQRQILEGIIKQTEDVSGLYVPVSILAIGPQAGEYANTIREKIGDSFNVRVDDSKAKIGVKLRKATEDFIAIVGIKEAQNGAVVLRSKGTDEEVSMDLNKFIAKVQKHMDERPT